MFRQFAAFVGELSHVEWKRVKLGLFCLLDLAASAQKVVNRIAQVSACMCDNCLHFKLPSFCFFFLF